MKVLKRELIGTKIMTSAPNGCRFEITIDDDLKSIELYKALNLDVFRVINTKQLIPINPNEVNPLTMNWTDLKKYAKKHKIEGNTKQQILDAINKG